ncbi:hypothetical protein HaLaN_13643 [Haematococcus lacustris]|uniref:Uncharacterized protein n=1 Tax=Haematococcus lacustris TaxID=44745 RepID=A0A699ZMN5_HAELA|nr:hypothetical protein HaLaN_13643 [Haematococcus lacustris]
MNSSDRFTQQQHQQSCFQQQL